VYAFNFFSLSRPLRALAGNIDGIDLDERIRGEVITSVSMRFFLYRLIDRPCRTRCGAQWSLFACNWNMWSRHLRNPVILHAIHGFLLYPSGHPYFLAR
jgi:hypothetical protein